MSRALDPAVAGRLAKILGRLGSPHGGERAAAALLADRLIRDSGATWEAALGIADAADDTPPTCHRALARLLLGRLPELSERDRAFLEGMADWWRAPSPKQKAWLAGLAVRAEARR